MLTATDKHVRGLRAILVVLAIIASALGIFALGVLMGYHEARFAGHFGDAYERNFVDGRGNFFFEYGPGAHGAAGKIVSIALPNIVVAGPDNTEKTITTDTATLVRKFTSDGKPEDLMVGDFVVVLGNPADDGTIAAKLIRIVPAPGSTTPQMMPR